MIGKLKNCHHLIQPDQQHIWPIMRLAYNIFPPWCQLLLEPNKFSISQFFLLWCHSNEIQWHNLENPSISDINRYWNRKSFGLQHWTGSKLPRRESEPLWQLTDEIRIFAGWKTRLVLGKCQLELCQKDFCRRQMRQTAYHIFIRLLQLGTSL